MALRLMFRAALVAALALCPALAGAQTMALPKLVNGLPQFSIGPGTFIAVPNAATTITGTNGLTGGGDLTASRTIGIANGGVVAAMLASGAVTGNLGYTPLAPSNNLSDLASAATARSNLGLTALATAAVSTGLTLSGSVLSLTNTSLTVAGQTCTLGSSCSISYANLSAGAPTATSSALGLVRPDGTTILNAAGVISVAYGTAANTAAQGNDSRITGALQTASLSAIGAKIVAATSQTASDANATIAAGVFYFAETALTAARTETLPPASGYPRGTGIVLADESGAASSSITISATAAGSDTIAGAASAVLIGSPYQVLYLESNGSNAWSVK